VVLRTTTAPEPAPRREHAVIALLAGILSLVLLGQAATAILHSLPPRIRFVSQETVYTQGVAVEWRLHLQIRGESVTAAFYSERELIRVTDELGGRER
jgi:hypothetical protein